MNAADIVAQLSEAQKRAVLRAKAFRKGPNLWLDDAKTPTLNALHNLGVSHSDEQPGHLTPLGLEVRAILQEQTNG